MTTRSILLMTGAALALAGCGGGSSVTRAPTIPASEQATRVYSDTAGDAGDVISNDETLTARSVASAGLTLDYDSSGPGNTGVVRPRAAIRRNANGELTLTVDGVDHDFTTADREVEPGGEVYGYQVEDDANSRYYSAFSQTGEIDEFFANGNGYAEVLGYQTNLVSGAVNIRGYAVFGTETRDADLAGLPTATYNGRGRLELAPATGWVNNETSRTTLRSDVNMTANFGAGTISGAMTNFTLRPPGGTDAPIAGSVAMNSAPFAVNAYQGRLAPDAAFSASTGVSSLNATYSGAFYGGAAQETGGVISGTGTRNGGAVNATGFFYANQ